MSNTQERLRRGLVALAIVLLASTLCAAQDDEAFKKLFATDFSKQSLAREQLKDLDLSDLKLLRGVVFGRHGRVFRDRDIQGYLKDQEWYKPDPNFTRRSLSAAERRNLAASEAAQRKQRHAAVSPGDMELFESRLVMEDMLRGLSLYELRLLRNEIYARRGRQFRTEWLSQYFYSQPWYDPRDDNKEPELSDTEKKNVEAIVNFERRLKESLSQQPIPKGLLEGMFLEDARKLRQEIYARHGQVFRDKWLQKYFQSFDWYKANPGYTDAALTAVERQNISAIAAYEKKAASVMDAVEG